MQGPNLVPNDETRQYALAYAQKDIAAIPHASRNDNKLFRARSYSLFFNQFFPINCDINLFTVGLGIPNFVAILPNLQPALFFDSPRDSNQNEII